MAETKVDKARRLLADGLLTVDVVGDTMRPELVVARCRGDQGEYRLGYDPRRRRWRCTCPAWGECSHLVALKLVVFRPEPMREPVEGGEATIRR